MHATPQEIAAPFAADIPQYQRDALQTIHKIMLHLAQSLTGEKPQEDDAEDPAHARNTTQRIRLTLQAARDLLRFRPSNSSDPQTPAADGRRSAQSTRPWRKPGQAQAPSTRPWRKPGLEGADTPEAQTAQASARASSHTDAADAASKLLAAAGAEVRSFGEGGRIIPLPDSGLSTHDSPAPAPPRDSSLVAHTSASAPPPDSGLSPHDSSASPPIAPLDTQPFISPGDPDFNPLDLPARRPLVYPPTPELYSRYPADKLPKIPAEFTAEEIDLFEQTLRTQNAFPKPLYNKLVAWRNHCGAHGLKHPLPVTWRMTQDRNPWTAEREARKRLSEQSSQTASSS